jgi:hypothetical protein
MGVLAAHIGHAVGSEFEVSSSHSFASDSLPTEVYTGAAKTATVITLEMTTVTFGKIQLMLLIVITLGHSLIDNNN